MHVIITYYCVLLHTWGFQLDFVVEGDVDALNIYRLFLAINLDCRSEEELQPSVPDVFWAQDKPFLPGWTVDLCQVCVSGLAELGSASTSSEYSIISISGVNDSSDISGVLILTPVNQTYQSIEILWKSVVISNYYYVWFCIGSSLLLI